jgi:RimJ/RimL family protein N-acetyltransferase
LQILSTARLNLRHLTLDDANFIFALTNDPDWIRFIGDRGIRTTDDACNYIANGPVAMYSQHGFGLYAVERREDHSPIGICGLLTRPWLDDVDIGFAFFPKFRGAGYAYEAAKATVEHAKTIGKSRLLAIVSPENDASLRLLTKLGMSFERMATPPGEESEVCVYGRALS